MIDNATSLPAIEEIPSHVFRYIERELFDYPVHKATLQTVGQERLDILKGEKRKWPPPEGRQEDGPASDPVLDTYLRLEALNIRAVRAQRNVLRIEAVFDTLSDEQRKLVELKYWAKTRLANDYIAKELGMGRSRFYEIRHEVVRMFALGYGLM